MDEKISMDCPVCGSAFNDRFDLTEHVRQKHPDVFGRMITTMPSLIELNTRKPTTEIKPPVRKRGLIAWMTKQSH